MGQITIGDFVLLFRDYVRLTVQRKCPFVVYRVSVSGQQGLSAVPTFSGLSALRYFLTEFLLIPKSLAIPRMDIPLLLALWIAFHHARCRWLGFFRVATGRC